MKIVGKRYIDIKNEKGSFQGYRFYCTDDSNPDVDGLMVDSFVASTKLIASLKRDPDIGDDVMPVYPKESKSLRTILFVD